MAVGLRLSSRWFRVIELVQVGDQAHADRYMYVPMGLGLLVMLICGCGGNPGRSAGSALAIRLAAAACLGHSRGELGPGRDWRNERALFRRALAVPQATIE